MEESPSAAAGALPLPAGLPHLWETATLGPTEQRQSHVVPGQAVPRSPSTPTPVRLGHKDLPGAERGAWARQAGGGATAPGGCLWDLGRSQPWPASSTNALLCSHQAQKVPTSSLSLPSPPVPLSTESQTPVLGRPPPQES